MQRFDLPDIGYINVYDLRTVNLQRYINAVQGKSAWYIHKGL